MVGRGEELAVLRSFLDDDSSAPALLVIDGEAGIGKSTIFSVGVEAGRERGLRVLVSRPAEAERGLAFAGLSDLLEDVLDDVVPELSVPRRRALEVALLLEENSTPFSGSMLLEPLAAEVHLAVAPHGKVDPALLPDQITKPIGNPAFWWIATFIA